MYTVQSTGGGSGCTQYRVQEGVQSVHSTEYRSGFSVYNVQCTKVSTGCSERCFYNDKIAFSNYQVIDIYSRFGIS